MKIKRGSALFISHQKKKTARVIRNGYCIFHAHFLSVMQINYFSLIMDGDKVNSSEK